MERLAYLSTEDRIEAEDLAFILSPRGQAPLAADLGQSLADATDRFQIDYIRRQIEQSGGNMSLAATRWACTARISTARCGNSGWENRRAEGGRRKGEGGGGK